jgi:endoglucanase
MSEYINKGNWTYMDELFTEIQKYNISICLDFHRLENTHQSSKPYNDKITFDMFLNAWKTILTRYKNIKNLKNVDIFNEYQGDNYVEWNFIARQIVGYLEDNFPNRFNYFVGGYTWGSDLHFVDLSDTLYKDRIFYTIHSYWFNTKEPMEEWWDYKFGKYKNIVNVGEWGYISTNENEVEWAERFVDWLISKDIHDSFFWTYSWNSQDTGGILKEDCETVDENKVNLLRILWSD